MVLATGSGCTVIRQSYDVPSGESALLEKGRTHYRDVLRALGPPAALSALGDGMVFLYEDADLTESQLGLNIRYRDTPVLKFVVGRGHADRGAAVLVFDRAGLVRTAYRQDWTQPLGTGLGLQVVVAVVPVTDPGGLDRSPAVHEWGAMLLEPELPVALNRQSSLDTGQGGLEQTGPLLSAGQHTLELRGSGVLP
jgi:hypothetical protein